MSSMIGSGGYGPSGGGSMNKVSGHKVAQISRLSPEQRELFSRLMGGSQGGLQAGLGQLSQMAAGGDEDYWRQLEAPAKRQFGELQGDIASRFSGGGGGPGAMSSRRGSGFYNEQGGAAADFAERLQSQRLGLQQNAIQQLMGLSGNLLQPGFQETFLQPNKLPFWRKALGVGLPIIGTATGAFFGGPAGAQMGAQVGSQLGNAFTNRGRAPQALPTSWGG